MYIGNLIQKESSINVAYTYMRRGVQVPSFPDLYKEEEVDEGYFSIDTGNLFNDKSIGWNWLTVLDIGVDIVFQFDRLCFIDRIVIKQGIDSGVQSVSVLCDHGHSKMHNLHYAGRLNAETGGLLENGLLEVPIGVDAQKVIIRIEGCFKDIIIEQLEIIGAVFDSHMVYPVPVSMKTDKGISMYVDDIERIVIDGEASEDIVFSAKLLKDKIYENHRREVPVVAMDNTKSFTKAIVISKGDESGLANLELPKLELFNSKGGKKQNEEAYSINALNDTVHLIGADRRGLIYGIETLLLLLKDGEIPICTVDDYPLMKIRGVHFGVPSRDEIPFVKRLIRYILAPMRMNTIFLQITAGMRFDRHPKINEAWVKANKKANAGEWPAVPHGKMIAGGSFLEKHEVAELVDYARSYGIEVIPEIQSLCHVQYITMAYPEVAETEEKNPDNGAVDLKKEDMMPSKFYKHSYCTLNEKSYAIIFDIIDEIVEVVRPATYVHMGHDEAYNIGTCPCCKGKDHAELFATHVNRLHTYLEKKHLKMMMWADMLQPVTTYKTSTAIAKIPKDIVLLDFIWYFHLDKDIEDNLLEHGFEVIMGNMYSSHYPRFETRSKKPGILGAEVSTWLQVNEYTFGFEGKLYDFIYSANMMWSSKYRSDARFSYERMISSILPRIRSQIHGEEYPSLKKVKKCITLKLPTLQNSRTIPWDLDATLPNEGEHILNGIPFQFGTAQSVLPQVAGRREYPETVRIPVDNVFDSLIFLHAAGENVERKPWMPLVQIGEYVVAYEDGTKVEVPVEYGGNIGVWYKRYNEPMKHIHYRHQGYVATYFADAYIQTKAPSGKEVTIYGFEWINPCKNKRIHSVTLAAKGNVDSEVMLFAVTGVRK